MPAGRGAVSLYGPPMDRPARLPAAADLMPGPLDAVSVREVMRAGVLTIVEDASLRQAFRAMASHGVHGILVVGRAGGIPLGWITARGSLARLDDDDALVAARDAVTERVVRIEPDASLAEARAALSQPATTHLLVCQAGVEMPEGVVSAMDLIGFAAGRH